jgi:hypothetical protein
VSMWIKSSVCNGAASCVEVAVLPSGNVAIRNTQDPEGWCVEATPAEWVAFTAGVRDGEFDLSALSAGDGSDGDGPARGAETAQAVSGGGSVPARTLR